VNNEAERIWKEEVLAPYTDIFLEGVGKITKNPVRIAGIPT
jgi:hypothetical protein